MPRHTFLCTKNTSLVRMLRLQWYAIVAGGWLNPELVQLVLSWRPESGRNQHEVPNDASGMPVALAWDELRQRATVRAPPMQCYLQTPRGHGRTHKSTNGGYSYSNIHVEAEGQAMHRRGLAWASRHSGAVPSKMRGDQVCGVGA